jgi:peroxiredoxin Q/BCP
MTLEVGKKAPNFKVQNQDGKEVTLDSYKGKYLVMYFYPKDMTSGCTKESQGFRDLKPEFDKLNAEIVGVSCDSPESHQKFIAKESLNFDLLADTEKEMVNAYGVWVEKSMYGKKYMGIQRDTFLIGPEGKLLKHYVKAKPTAHPGEVLKDLQAI